MKKVPGIAAAILVYGGILSVIVWMMVTYPIDH